MPVPWIAGRCSMWQASTALPPIGGAISLIPGGVGPNEARVTGLLILCGVDGGAGGAISKGMLHQFPFGPESMDHPQCR